ncbi:virulence-associated E family protein [Sphingobium sp. CCH11-B1]|uniref:virulence-associated E family protein n=1 Tax=Sphingobium sp. CCH11-B1 TaxID=1768781 RepID=UPI000A879A5F|nr:virulence-associated E family protein [Sphingobium sp. CCH11-B1]
MADVIDLNAWRHNLQMGDKGPKRNLTNTIAHLRGLQGLGKSLRFNEMTQAIEWNGKPIEDPDVVDIRLIIERNNYQPQDRDIRPAIDRVCRENRYNPVTDYLNSLKWDGTPRLERWMPHLLGAPASDFVKLVGPKVLISAVARAYEPGCKVDTIMVLEGEQGLKKSSAIAALFGEEYTAESVSLFDQHNKMVMQMMGAWCVELAEFVAVVRKEQGAVKGLISMRSDRVVLPYAKMASTHPRRCIFFGTINPDSMGYLTDSTGNRRYWPVTVTRIDIEGILKSRDQLWAEAVHRFRQGERWWLEDDENKVATVEQVEREEEDAWTPILKEKLVGKAVITTNDALTELGIPHERKDKRAQMRAATALVQIGYERFKVRPAPGAKPIWAWRRKE